MDDKLHCHSYEESYALYFHPTGARPMTVGGGSGSIFISDVGCRGQELSILDCYFSTTSSGCDHSQDAGVICEGLLHTCTCISQPMFRCD